MADQLGNPFDHVPRNAGGHFVLNLYAAIYRLIHQTRRLAAFGGAELEEVFERFPFLAEYFHEMRRHMPDDLTWDRATVWWHTTITTWEKTCPGHLPLKALAEQADLGFSTRLAFMVTGLVEEDSRFGTLLAELQQPLVSRRPTLELVGQMMMDSALVGESDPWTICRPLLAGGLVEVQSREAPRSEWLLRVPPLLWDAVRGQVDPHLSRWCRFHTPESFPPIDRLIFPDDLLRRLGKVPDLLRSGRARMVVLRSVPGADPIRAVGAIGAALGRGLIELETGGEHDPETARLLGPLCALANAIPCLCYDLGPGETAQLPPLTGYDAPLAVCLGPEGGLASDRTETAVTFTLPTPRAELRELHWREATLGQELDDLDQVVERFHLGGGFIRAAARTALAQAGLEGRDRAGIADVQEATRALNRQLLDTLASPMPAYGSWSDLVAGDGTRDKLLELARRCRHRERLLDFLGPAFGAGANRGVRALFTGASGTGKTLAARILAAVLGMDLYRVDLAAVINKYIGETEKNLHQVLTRAEALDVLLLLDEGDALLGQRTEVKSANDRYANLETNYLLQRLEHYQGVVVVTTNFGDNIDQAFQRRMDVVVPFFLPQPDERLHILELHLPNGHAVQADMLERVALRCALTGSQIRNAVLLATLLGLEVGGPVTDEHLLAGLRSEYRKAGGICPLEPAIAHEWTDGTMESFVSAFARS